MTRAVILFCSALAAQELAPKSAPAPGVAAKLPQARMLTLAAPSAAEFGAVSFFFSVLASRIKTKLRRLFGGA